MFKETYKKLIALVLLLSGSGYGVGAGTTVFEVSKFDYPILANQDIEKLEWVYSAQEKLRLEHNEKGKQFREGEITEAQWEEYKAKEFNSLNTQLGEERYDMRKKLGYDILPPSSASSTPEELAENERVKEETTQFKASKTYNIDTTKILKENVANGATEDFTTFTENDPGSDLSITASTITVSNLKDNGGVHNVYYDYGADYFDALNIDVETQMSSGSTNNGQFGPAFVNTTTPDTEERTTLASTDIWVMMYVYNSNYDVRLIRGAYATADIYFGRSVNTLYYDTFGRTAGSDTVTYKIYSDSARTTLLDTLTVSGYGTSTKWQYAYGLIQHAKSDNANMNGSVANFDFNISAPVAPDPIYQDLIWFE